MFVDFNRVFNNKPQTELKIPDALVDRLNANLPTGVRYVADDDGNCRIVSEEGSFTIGGLIYKPTEEHKKVLGKKFTHEDVLNYSYNAQKPIPLGLKKDGYIILNGEEFPIEKMSYKPYNPVTYISGSMFMYPHPFPGPFPLKVGCEKYTCELLFQRIPNESVNIAAFESEKEKPLFVKYFLDETKSKISFTISFNLAYAKTIRDVVESTTIYNAYLEGKGLFCGKPLIADIDASKLKKYDPDSIAFWEKILRLEEVLNVQFTPPHDDVDFSVISMVETLYQNLVENNPVRIDKKIDSLDGEWKMTSEEEVKDSIGKPVYFEFQATSSGNLFGMDFDFPCMIGVFNAKLANYTVKGEHYSLILENESEDKPMYTSVQRFLTEEMLTDYMSGDRNERITAFHDAKSVQYYLEKQ